VSDHKKISGSTYAQAASIRQSRRRSEQPAGEDVSAASIAQANLLRAKQRTEPRNGAQPPRQKRVSIIGESDRASVPQPDETKKPTELQVEDLRRPRY
jgi:hypothetical protein